MSTEEITTDRRRFRAANTLFYAVLTLMIAWPATRWAGVNAQVRFATTVQIVEHGTLELGEFAATTSDKAVVDGRAFSDKAPALSFLLVPFYAVARLFTSDFDVARHLTRLMSLTFAVMLTLLAWSRRMERDGVSDTDRMTCLAFFGVGTVAWAYWAMLYSHGPTALAVFWGVRLLMDYKSDRSLGRLAWSGAAFGLAILLEYPAAVLGAVAGVYLLSFERDTRRVAVFAALGAVLPAAALVSYNMAVFGEPFALGYHFEHSEFYREQMSRGVMGVGVPTWSGFFLTMLSPSKGLLFWSPSVLAAFAGLIWMVRKRRAEGLFLSGLVVAYVIVFSGYFEASGGACLGPRHLVPLAGPLAIALAAWLPNAGSVQRGAAVALVIAGAMLAAMGVAADPQVHDAFVNPLHEFMMPLLERGFGAGNIFGLRPLRAAAALYALIFVLGVLIAIRLRGPNEKARRRWGIAFGLVMVISKYVYIDAAADFARTDPGILHQAWGNHWSLNRQWNRAADDYALAYASRKDPYILFYWTKALARSGRHDEAREIYEKLRAEFPGFIETTVAKPIP